MNSNNPSETANTETSPTIATLLAKIDELTGRLSKLETTNAEVVEFNRTLINRTPTSTDTGDDDPDILTPEELAEIDKYLKGE